MTLLPKFTIGQTVYLKVSSEIGGMVVGLVVRPGNTITYLVAFGDETDERCCFDIELTEDKSFDV